MGMPKSFEGAQMIVLPPQAIWFDDLAAAQYLSYTVDYYQTHIICLPNFPKPRYVGKGRRWNAQEISDWLDRQTGEPEKKIGRPRKKSHYAKFTPNPD